MMRIRESPELWALFKWGYGKVRVASHGLNLIPICKIFHPGNNADRAEPDVKR